MIDAINSANNNRAEGGCRGIGAFGTPDTIRISATGTDQTFTVSSAINPTEPNDYTAFPFIRSAIVVEGRATNQQLINIVGDPGVSRLDFRFFKVLDGASLTLKNISLANGRLLPDVSQRLSEFFEGYGYEVVSENRLIGRTVLQ